MQTVTIPVSEAILIAANMDTEEMASAMSRVYAMKMFQQGKISNSLYQNILNLAGE
jgi:hypothetical protein